MEYVKVAWEHEFPDDPVLFISEVGGDGYEVRKVQIYRDGRSEWADVHHETATAGLSEISFPSIDEISRQPGCRAERITSKEFEQIWNNARAGA